MEDLFFVNKNLLAYDKIIIYGSGHTGKNMLFKLLQRNIKVECFADSNPDVSGSRFMNVPIIHIDELNHSREEAAIIVCGLYALPVAEELEKRGFKNLFFDYGNEVNIIHIEREM